MNIRLAVFDCDGTLVDGQAAVCETMELAFARAAMPAPSRHDIRHIVGLSLPVAVRSLAPDATHDQCDLIVQGYKSAFREARASGQISEPLYDGIADLLARLDRGGWQLGVATGKSDRGLKNCLTMHGLMGHFCTLQTADRHPSKPHPSMLEEAMADALARPEQTVMIGDTTFDMEMARAAGVRAIGVSWGYHRPEDLIAAGAQAVAANTAELGELLW